MAVGRLRSTWPTLRLVAVPLQREPVSGARQPPSGTEARVEITAASAEER